MIEGDGNLFSLKGDSTINHVGFLLLALAVFYNSSIESFVFYLIQYTITNLNIFLIILALSYNINKKILNTYLNVSKPSGSNFYSEDVKDYSNNPLSLTGKPLLSVDGSSDKIKPLGMLPAFPYEQGGQKENKLKEENLKQNETLIE